MLTKQEIFILVNDYIEVNTGYLGNFSYRSHREFYPQYCGFEIDVNAYSGTTREIFIEILSSVDSDKQILIIRGIFKKYPISYFDTKDQDKKKDIQNDFENIITRIQKNESNRPSVSSPKLDIHSDIVHRAIRDIEILIKENDVVSSVDRVHTKLHAYIRAICNDESIILPRDASLPASFNILIKNHSKFSDLGDRQEDVLKILRSIGAILDSLGPIRNMSSMAHPNDLLGKNESMLVLNASRTILHYIESVVNG